MISAQFTIDMRVQAKPEIAEKSPKAPILGVQGHRYPHKALSSACYDKQQVCAYLQPLSR